MQPRITMQVHRYSHAGVYSESLKLQPQKSTFCVCNVLHLGCPPNGTAETPQPNTRHIKLIGNQQTKNCRIEYAG